MPKNASKTGKSSKTARVLSLLTDPAASLLGGSRNHKDDDETEALDERKAQGLDDEATESRIQASLAAEEDSLVTELFGKKETPSRPRRTQEAPQAPSVEPEAAPPAQSAAPASNGQEPDPRTLELLSMLSNPSTLGNSAMPSAMDEAPLRPVALEKDFADELTAGMPEQPAPPQENEDADAAWAAQAAPQYEPMRQEAPPSVQRPAQAAQPAPQPVRQPMRQEAPPSVQRPAQAAQPAPQPMRQEAPPSAQPVQQAPQRPAQAVQQTPQRPAAQPAPRPVEENENEHFVCFNLTQALVEDKAEKLMRQFGMCTCNRCKVDVTAIALSNLPAKYVAMQNRDILPLLSMYEEKYSAAVTVQVMNACRMVMKRPHHGR